ncbi:hypothetical protein [Flavobacterium sp. KACC 22763]|uniref:hypothetical protein n=1 Tax=Flavobacterium sp. KACC 22763 TaxID=3025668 RepID=UPI0023653990|nr:hypothetical protein [Flavobacterium sp. KACC 22763]WDF63171.1 hypothetical protein PQ463_16310 [Flavobacterium sp. KACC 22763]
MNAQRSTKIDVSFRLKPDRSIAKENISFYFDVENGKLLITDIDIQLNNSYLIRFDKTFYDNAGLYNMVFSTDIVNHTLEKRPKSDMGLFSIIYDEKNGNIVGVKTVFQNSDLETYLTQYGATFLNKN